MKSDQCRRPPISLDTPWLTGAAKIVATPMDIYKLFVVGCVGSGCIQLLIYVIYVMLRVIRSIERSN